MPDLSPADRNLLAWLHALVRQTSAPTHVFDMEIWLDRDPVASDCGTIACSAGTAILANVGGVLDKFPLPVDVRLYASDERLEALRLACGLTEAEFHRLTDPVPAIDKDCDRIADLPEAIQRLRQSLLLRGIAVPAPEPPQETLL